MSTIHQILMVAVLGFGGSNWPPDNASALDYCDQRSPELQAVVRMMEEDGVHQLWVEGIDQATVYFREEVGGEVKTLDRERNNTYSELLSSIAISEVSIRNGFSKFRIGYRTLDSTLIEAFCAVGDSAEIESCGVEADLSLCGQCAVSGRETFVLYSWGIDEYPGQTECGRK